jgi:hypothetical protein
VSTSLRVREAAPPCRSLAEYVAALIERLGDEDPALLVRLGEVVGARHARITLDQETVDVHFQDGGVVVTEATCDEVDGEGSTDRQTTLDLLDGRLEVTDAILEGRLRATGEVESVVRIFQAIEILLDGSTRNPGLQRLALNYGVDPCRPGRPPGSPLTAERRVVVDPDHIPPGEAELLRRLDLLP